MFDGVRLDKYGCTSEWINNGPDGIGTFCHEFGHVLGLPDLYATSYTGAFTPGSWMVMDSGSYNNNSHTPPLHSAFERYALGWIEPRLLSKAADVEIQPMSANDACIVKAGKDEYFLFENRQQTGWDTYLPGHGMLVTHVRLDGDAWGMNRVNNDPEMMLVDIEEADGIPSADTRAGDAFPGTAGATSFTDDTTPSMRNWDDQRLSMPVTDITETDGIIRFKIAGGAHHFPAPNVLEPTDITPEGFTIHWERVAEAADYRLAISDGEMTPVEGYEAILTGDTDTYTVKGLTPDTRYRYTLTAIDADGCESDEPKVNDISTALPTLEYKSVENYEPEAVSTDSWKASWSSLEEAEDYELTVMTMGEGRPYSILCPFDDGVKALPEGWTTDCTLTFANKAYAGAAIPSVKMNADGCYIQSPETEADIRGISFWHRGVSSAAENSLKVEGLTDGEWQTLGEFEIINDAPGAVTTLSDIPAGTRAARISLNLKGRGSVAIDDVEVLWGARHELVAIPGYDALSSGGATSLLVKVDDPQAEYHYFVTAVNGTRRSLPSNIVKYIPATTVPAISSGATSLITFHDNSLHISAPRGTRWTVCDITGTIVASGLTDGVSPTVVALTAPGIYIAKIEGKTLKVIR